VLQLQVFKVVIVKSIKGFSLIELLVAMAVLAIVAVAATSGLSTVVKARETTRSAGKELVDLQRAFVFLEQDLSSVINRPIRDAFGSEQPAIVVGDSSSDSVIEFSRRGWPDIGAQQPLSDLARVAYELEEDFSDDANRDGNQKPIYKLYRKYWRHVDRADEEKYRKRRIASGINELKLRFFSSGAWGEEWPPRNQTFGTQSSLPRAIEVTLVSDKWGEIRRVFLVQRGE
jgi:general secretion pathway protein J